MDANGVPELGCGLDVGYIFPAGSKYAIGKDGAIGGGEGCYGEEEERAEEHLDGVDDRAGAEGISLKVRSLESQQSAHMYIYTEAHRHLANHRWVIVDALSEAVSTSCLDGGSRYCGEWYDRSIMRSRK